MKRARAAHRGFALLIVMVLAIAMVAIASALTLSAGHLTVASIHSEGAELARLAAESGMARAEAWALEVRATAGNADFDAVLDPDFANANGANCANLTTTPFNATTIGAAPKAGPTTFLPKFTDGSIVQFPGGSGRRWYRVVFGRGAYLVRYEDNADDGIPPAGDWSARTNNSVGANGAAPFCVEGDVAAAGADNPARDRDGAIWVHVIGIAPGTDPTTASHRVMLRKLVRTPVGTPGGPAMFVNGSIDLNAQGSNSVGSVSLGGSITNANPFCGRVEAGGSNNATANAACSGANPLSIGTSVAYTPPTIPNAQDAQWYDWSKPCVFYSQPGVGLFYWDAAATRGGSACNTYMGAMVAPNPDPAQVPANGSCWTPIMLQTDQAGGQDPVLPYEPYEDTITDQVSRASYEASGCAAFSPQASGAGLTYADPGGGWTTANHTPGDQDDTFKSWFTTPTTVTRPTWTSCNGVTWGTGPGIGVPVTSSLSGSTILHCSTDYVSADETLQFLGGSPGAYVTGVVYKEGNYTHVRDMSGTPPTTLSDSPRAWPMITLAVPGNVLLNNAADVWWGAGTSAGGKYPSLIVNGALDGSAAAGSATARFAGAVYVLGNVSAKKEIIFFGPVYVAGSVAADPSGSIIWDYDFDFFGTGAPGAAGPQPILSYPVGF